MLQSCIQANHVCLSKPTNSLSIVCCGRDYPSSFAMPIYYSSLCSSLSSSPSALWSVRVQINTIKLSTKWIEGKFIRLVKLLECYVPRGPSQFFWSLLWFSPPSVCMQSLNQASSKCECCVISIQAYLVCCNILLNAQSLNWRAPSNCWTSWIFNESDCVRVRVERTNDHHHHHRSHENEFRLFFLRFLNYFSKQKAWLLARLVSIRRRVGGG